MYPTASIWIELDDIAEERGACRNDKSIFGVHRVQQIAF